MTQSMQTQRKLLRMYCIDTEALVFMFNGGSSDGFTINPIFTRICIFKGPLLVYIYHINNEKYMHHGFLAPQAYPCSTSLSVSVKPSNKWEEIDFLPNSLEFHLVGGGGFISKAAKKKYQPMGL